MMHRIRFFFFDKSIHISIFTTAGKATFINYYQVIREREGSRRKKEYIRRLNLYI